MSQAENKSILAHHSICLGVSLYFLVWAMSSDGKRGFFDDFCQFTSLNQTLITICYCAMLIYDILILSRKETPYSGYRYPDAIYILFQAVFSLGALVMSSYWGMRLYDYTLLVPKGENAPPLLLSCYTHGINFLMLFFESLIIPQKSHKSYKFKFILYACIIITYVGVQITFWKVTGKYVYPFLAVFTLEMTMNFYAALFVLCFLFDRSGHIITTKRWERRVICVSEDSKAICQQRVIYEESMVEEKKSN
jgi:hypothetical protein